MYRLLSFVKLLEYYLFLDEVVLDDLDLISRTKMGVFAEMYLLEGLRMLFVEKEQAFHILFHWDEV